MLKYAEILKCVMAYYVFLLSLCSIKDYKIQCISIKYPAMQFVCRLNSKTRIDFSLISILFIPLFFQFLPTTISYEPHCCQRHPTSELYILLLWVKDWSVITWTVVQKLRISKSFSDLWKPEAGMRLWHIYTYQKRCQCG